MENIIDPNGLMGMIYSMLRNILKCVLPQDKGDASFFNQLLTTRHPFVFDPFEITDSHFV